MANFKVAVATVAVELPEGVTAGQWSVKLVKADGTDASPALNLTDPNTAAFDNITAGVYYAIVQRLDATGAALGAAVQSAQVTVATYDAPATVTLS